MSLRREVVHKKQGQPGGFSLDEGRRGGPKHPGGRGEYVFNIKFDQWPVTSDQTSDQWSVARDQWPTTHVRLITVTKCSDATPGINPNMFTSK